MAQSVPSNMIEQAQSMVLAWRELNPELKLGSLTLKELEDGLAESLNHREAKAQLKTQMKDRNQSQKNSDYDLWKKIKRGRAGSKSQFGDDAKEYAMFGGTRQSQRKSSTRRSTKAK